MYAIRLASALVLLAGAAAGATPVADPGPPVVYVPPAPPPPPPAPPAAMQPPKTLRGTSLYVYSFLDIREQEYTPAVLAELNAALAAQFAQGDVRATIFNFKDSPISEGYTSGSAVGAASTIVPVRQIIRQNRDAEVAAGAQYRMIIFPVNYSIAGAWRFYDIRWGLEDIATGARLWSYVYSGKHMVMWANSENKQARSKKIVDAAFASMHTRGIE